MISIRDKTYCSVRNLLMVYAFFSVNSPQATIENFKEDYTDYDNVVDRRTQSRVINGVTENVDRHSGLDPNNSIQVLHNPYYDGDEQLNGPKSVVQINNPYYGEE